MSALNKRVVSYDKTYEGAKTRTFSPETQLTRLVLANMLWEDQFYIDGKSSADLITELVPKTSKQFVSNLALQARHNFKLRHVPLYLTRELAKLGRLSADALTAIIERPDELGEFLSLYWKDGRSPLSNQVKKGLANAFSKFSEYQFAKWDKNNAGISLRDVMFMVHPKPTSKEQETLFKKIANRELDTPDTWETQLSAGADKKETFVRLMAEKKLGALAFLRNLRNMVQSGVDENLIREYAKNIDVSKVLPFRYIAAARIVPQFEDMLEDMMFRSLELAEKLPGKTLLLVDVSGSMFGAPVSRKSDLDRFDAAAALSILCREICENVDIYSFSSEVARVAPRRGFALVENLVNSQPHTSTRLGAALQKVDNGTYDRIIVFTDEQTRDKVPDPRGNANGYIINVAAYNKGINNGSWTTISGFSEAVLGYVQLLENEKQIFA